MTKSDVRHKPWIVRVDGGKPERMSYSAAVKAFNAALDNKQRVSMKGAG